VLIPLNLKQIYWIYPCLLVDDLYDNLTFLEDNPYVSHEEYIPVIARIPFDGRLVNKGKVSVTVGYGSKTESFSVRIGGSGPDDGLVPGDGLAPIDIDESLSLPSKAIPVQRKNDLNMQFSDRFSTIFSSLDQSINIKHIIVLFSSIVIVALIYMLIRSLPSGDTSYSINIGFYPAIALSILFTSLMAYLFIKLSALKK
jgi:hypothetical protein